MITCAEAAAFFRLSAGRKDILLSEVLGTIVGAGVAKAKEFIGNSQEGWAPLSTATTGGFRHRAGFWIQGKDALGYGGPPDYDPLLRSGSMRDTIEGEVDGLVGVIGSASKIALYQELGTEGAEYPIPPRPFLAKALQEVTPEAVILLEEVAVKLLVPGRL